MIKYAALSLKGVSPFCCSVIELYLYEYRAKCISGQSSRAYY